MGHVKSQSCAVPLRRTTNCWANSSGPWEIEAKANLWTMGFDFCVTNTSSMSMSLFGSSEKNLGYLFIIDVWTASSAQLYNWMLVCAGGMFVLYFDLRPGQKCHSKVMHRKEVTHFNGSYERKSCGQKLADEMGRGKKKFPWYTHRLMHQKRVICELHDSYFRLMTIKHAIPKIK